MKPVIAFLIGAAAATVVTVVALVPNMHSGAPTPAEVVPAAVEAEPVAELPAPLVAQAEIQPAVETPSPVRKPETVRQLFQPPVIVREVPAPSSDFAEPPVLQPASWSPGQNQLMTAGSRVELPPPEPNQVTLTEGTLLTVRLIDRVASDRQRPGDVFLATLDQPIVADGFVIAERGADVEGRVVSVEHSGRVKGKASVVIQLTRFTTSDGQAIDIDTQPFEREAVSETADEARKVGAAASIGALIGAIAGGGKGAAIGAAIGGGASTGAVLATKGQPAVLESETRITFRLNNPVTIVEKI